MIDTESYPRAWEEAFARGCLTERVARCRAADIRSLSDGTTAVAPSRTAVEVGRAGLSHPTTSEAR